MMTPNGLELFYNVGVTPRCHLTAEFQVITTIWNVQRPPLC